MLTITSTGLGRWGQDPILPVTQFCNVTVLSREHDLLLQSEKGSGVEVKDSAGP